MAKLNYLNLKRSYFFVTFAFIVLLNNSEAKQLEQDPNYISKFKTRLNFRLQVNQNNFRQAINPLSSLVYTKSELNNAQLNYGSYLPFSSGFSFNFMFGGFGIDFRFTEKYFNKNNKPVTNFKDFKLNIVGNKLCFEAYYDRFKRNYYLREDKLFSPLPNFDSQISSSHWGLSMRLITNASRFSYKAAFMQSEFQKKSAATFLVWFGTEQNQLLRPQGLFVDTTVKRYYENLQQLTKLRQQAWFVLPGFAGNIVYQQFYFATSVYVGSGPQFNKQYTDTAVFRKVNLPFMSKARGSLGINGKTVYTGIFANVDYTRSTFQTLKSEYFNYKMGVFLGVRLIKQTKTKAEKQEEKRKLKEDKNRRA
ncbi:MAG: DUF4421 family protein [Bacteroidetes bacterium]|nr:DUF4421 family protein [Bacteroidota bacterium]